MITSFYWYILFPSFKGLKLFISIPRDMEKATLGHLGTLELKLFAK